VIIPAFNEANSLPGVLQEVRDSGINAEVVVVDDGSSDGTDHVAQSHGATLLRHPFNMGYGTALQTGYKYALETGSTTIIQMDADGQHSAFEIPKLLEPLERDDCDLIVGSRFLDQTGYRMGFAKSIGREFFRFTAKLSGLSITDPTSGLQAMNREVAAFYSGDFFPHDYPDVDVLLAAHRAGFRVQECSVAMSEGVRASTLHGGVRDFYYVYKVMLSLWSIWAGGPVRKH
jgi:glycosyltransferase involved in cell wall biosynthesis